MTVTETTHQGWFSRLGNAFKGILAGIVLILVAIVLLFWNEGRTVNRYKALKEGAGKTVAVSSDQVDPAHEGQLVYMTGKAVTDETLTDPDFGVAVNALKLRRNAEMFQWSEVKQTETKRKVGGGEETTTTYSYQQVWETSPIDSTQFKEKGHENPATMPFSSKDFVAQKITVGAFTLSDSLKGEINNFTDYSLPAEVKETPQTEEPAETAPTAETADKTISVDVDNRHLTEDATIASAEAKANRIPLSNGYYLGKDANAPQIGDVRVTFSVVNPTDVSLVSQQTGDSFVPYQAKTGTVELLRTAIISQDQMFAAAQSENKILAWILRAVGLLLATFGIGAILQPLAVLADVIPAIGSVVRVGTGFISFLLAMILSLVVIAIAWFYYRPLLSLPMFGGALALILFVRLKLKKRPAAQ